MPTKIVNKIPKILKWSGAKVVHVLEKMHDNIVHVTKWFMKVGLASITNNLIFAKTKYNFENILLLTLHLFITVRLYDSTFAFKSIFYLYFYKCTVHYKPIQVLDSSLALQRIIDIHSYMYLLFLIRNVDNIIIREFK